MKKLLLVLGLFLVGNPLVRAQADSESAKPPMGLDQLSAYSIFYENYKNKEYSGALRYGRWIHHAMPRKLKGYSKFDLERNLDRLITTYTQVAKNTEDPGLREAYLDTAVVIYNKVFDTFSEDEIDMFDWKFELGRFYQENSNFIDNGLQKAYGIYEELYNQNPKKFSQLADGYYLQVLLQHMVSEGEKDKALAVIETTEPYAPSEAKNYFDQVRNQLFDSPEERIAFLEQKREENPEDSEILNQLAELYEDQNMSQKAFQVRKKLYELDPTYENTLSLADFAINNANYDTAINYLKEAMNKTDNAEEQSEIALKLSDAYKNKENLRQAREYARQAADLNSDWGEPYIQIASIYADAVNQCTSGRKMEREDKVVYWLVLDYLDKAKRVDQNVTGQVERQYQSYEPVTPTTEEKFFKGWEKGDKMKVDNNLMSCYDWINETTTVR